MSKSNPEEEKQLDGPGWTSYHPIPDDWNFGCFIVEYSILNGYGNFRYSQNNGIEFHKYSETELSKDHQFNLEIMKTFFIEAEEHLYTSIKDRMPTYYPTNLFL